MSTILQAVLSMKPRPQGPLKPSPPITSLCPDLLGSIMLWTIFVSGERSQRQIIILSLAQTCSSWRSIILAVPHIWSSLIDFESCSEDWLKELLRRSDPLLIDINKRCYLPREGSIVSLQMDYLHRFRTYRAFVDEESWEVLEEKMCYPAPQLEALELILAETSISSGVIQLPLNAFAGNAPSLRRLSLTRFKINFSLPILMNLRTLSVSHIPSPYAPTSLQWLESLRGMPSLTQLSIKDAISLPRRKSSKTAISDDQVSLPALSQLYIDGSLSCVSAILNQLVFPAHCAVTISCSDAKMGQDFDRLRRIFTQRFNHMASSQSLPSYLLRSLSVSADSSTLSITNEPSEYDTSLNWSMADSYCPCLYLELQLESEDLGHAGWAEMLTSFVTEMDQTFCQITSLELQLPSVPASLTLTLAKANQLETLVNLSGVMTKKLLPILQKESSSMDVMLLPSLKCLVFTKDDSMWGSHFRILQAFLRWRNIAGASLGKIEFRGCVVLDDTAKALEYLGVRVSCDAEGVRWDRL